MSAIEGDRLMAGRTVAVTGASGLIGRAVTAALKDEGVRVLPLVRRAPGPGEAFWDPEAGILDAGALEGADAVVHLAGDNLGQGRWTPAKKARILESRVRGTRVLCGGLARVRQRPAVLVCASAIGFYGDGGEAELDETCPKGAGFLPEVCAAWEEAAAPARDSGIRVVHLRIGVVLSRDGGALREMLAPFRLGLGGPVGSGRQFLSWVALPDVAGAILWCLRREDLSGPVNATAPGAVRQREFACALGKVLGRPAFMTLPGFAVRLALGEKGEALLLEGARIAPRKLLTSGFEFQLPGLEPALRSVLGRSGS